MSQDSSWRNPGKIYNNKLNYCTLTDVDLATNNYQAQEDFDGEDDLPLSSKYEYNTPSILFGLVMSRLKSRECLGKSVKLCQIRIFRNRRKDN